MKQLLLLASIVLSLTALAGEKAVTPFAKADKIVWAGLDYTQARFISPVDFAAPEKIFPGMLDAWNHLVLQERLSFLEKALHKPVVTDIAGVMKNNHSSGASQIISAPGADDTIKKSHLTPETVAQAVRSYQLESTSGVAVVFIVDRFIKIDKKGLGAVYVVAFDVATREVFFSQRAVSPAVGYGFRNYWFRVIKNSEKVLGKIR